MFIVKIIIEESHQDKPPIEVSEEIMAEFETLERAQGLVESIVNEF